MILRPDSTDGTVNCHANHGDFYVASLIARGRPSVFDAAVTADLGSSATLFTLQKFRHHGRNH
jgi:hypothetical protein